MKYIYELIGTFFLVFTIGMVVIMPPPDVPLGFAPLAIGTVLAVVIFVGGHVSGGMYNPAVSLAVAVRGKMSYADMVIYWVAQLAGAAAAGYLVIYMKGAPAATPFAPDMTKALIAEFVFTFLLTFTVLNVATAKGTENNSFYGWAIGMSVLAGAYAVGTVSGGAFNPAVAVGVTLMGLFSWTNIWIYFVANLAAGIVAALIFKAAHPGE
jgi:aquaporin Z